MTRTNPEDHARNLQADLIDTHDLYRERARRILSVLPGASVDTHAHTKIMRDGGAYVECVLWVPGNSSHE
jgi:hypothetical protein